MTPLFGSVISERTRFVSSAFPIQRFIYDIMLNFGGVSFTVFKTVFQDFSREPLFPDSSELAGATKFFKRSWGGFSAMVVRIFFLFLFLSLFLSSPLCLSIEIRLFSMIRARGGWKCSIVIRYEE